jgi:hypothetical protein
MNSSPAAPSAEPGAIGPALWSWCLGPDQRLAALLARLGPAALAGGLIAAIGGAINPAAAQQAGYGQTLGSSQQEREVDFGTGPKRSGSILDSTNPLELMNKLRRGTALDNATPPGDAVDAALKDFQVQSAPQSQSSPLPSGRISAGQLSVDQPSAGQPFADRPSTGQLSGGQVSPSQVSTVQSATDQKSAGQQQPNKSGSQIPAQRPTP